MAERMGRRRYRYDVRHFKIEAPHGYHQCTGQVVAVLSSTFSHERNAWYITVLCRMDEVLPDLTEGDQVWSEAP